MYSIADFSYFYLIRFLKKSHVKVIEDRSLKYKSANSISSHI